ncbi:MAG: hypothetical protein AB8G99_25385, partial [Planctomycetaceae bacterium]
MLPITTFRRLFAEHFPNQSDGVIFKPVDKREPWLKELAKQLGQKRRVSCFVSRRHKDVVESAYLGIQIAAAWEDPSTGDYLNLQSENRNPVYRLWLVERSSRQRTTKPAEAAVT